MGIYLLGFFRENCLVLIMLVGAIVMLAGFGNEIRSRAGKNFPYIVAGLVILLIVQYMERYFAQLTHWTIWRSLLSAISYDMYPLLLVLFLKILIHGEVNQLMLWTPFMINTVVSALMLLNTPLTVHFGTDNHFSRGALGFVPFATSYWYLFLLGHYATRYFKERNWRVNAIYVFIVVSLIVGNCIDMLSSDLVLNEIIVFDILVYSLYITVSDRLYAAREQAKAEMQLYHMQIQPHFIYNSLGVIRVLIPDECEAKEVLDQFTRFLRGSVDMLATTECIPFERELATVESYLYMEQRRFGDSIQVEMDIRDKSFLLPPFTMQILVENAIKHGIRQKKGGRGTLILRCYREEEEHVIEVEDDGVGFVPEEVWMEQQDSWGKDGREHIGLMNVKKRLTNMCDGKLEVESEPGKGTLVRILIREENAKAKKLEKTGRKRNDADFNCR